MEIGGWLLQPEKLPESVPRLQALLQSLGLRGLGFSDLDFRVFRVEGFTV